MKQLNVAFDRLRGVMPDVKTITKEEKDTKVKNSLLNIFRYQKTFMFCTFKFAKHRRLKKKIVDIISTQVTTLRAAISYISGLQSLLADCEAGLVDPAQFKVI